MIRLAFLIAALALLGACGSRAPAGYVPPTRADASAAPVLAPIPFKQSPVVSARSDIQLF
ncbi:MAG: hypothetical protein AAGF60_01410 [Pseudomonadota bacterium]